VFKLDKDGKATVLYGFKGHPTDGWEPTALLIEDSLGNLYGTTAMGGETDLGTVFKLNTRNKESILYNFKGPIGGGGDGAYPGEGVIRDTAGNLYGGTAEGGDDGKGTVFKVDSSGNESVLYSFSGGLDGAGADAGCPMSRDFRDMGIVLRPGTTQTRASVATPCPSPSLSRHSRH
jgi:uncharacterized repeat protein (TIGR03803 family)